MKLYKHQIDGLQRTKDLNRVAYYWDMGLGKTFTGAEKLKQLGATTNLVICQKSKINDWIEHFEKYYNFVIFDLTNKKQFDNFFSVIKGGGVLVVGIINYELAWRRKELLQLQNFTLMLDESSLIQNSKAKQTKFIMRMKPLNVILLSGTPTAGRYENLVTQAHLLGWDISERTYNSTYVNWDTLNIGNVKIKVVRKYKPYKNVERLKDKLREHGADFLKTEDVMTLPEQNFQIINVSASKEYRKFCKDKVLALLNGVELIGDTQLTERLHQRELCGMYSKEKLQAFKDLLDSTQERIIVFYSFTDELHTLQKIASERPQSVVNGTTKDLTTYEQNDNSVTFVQYQAGAMGLNLQKANKIIYFTLPDGRSDLFEQSKKRIHRIGQARPCFYYILNCKGTVEDEIIKTLDIRRDYTDYLFKE